MANLYAKTLRPLARQMAVKAWPGPFRANRKILVSGMPRSGTSWVARVLSLADGVSYYFEPDYSLDKSYNFKYLGLDDENAYLHKFMRRAFLGGINNEYVIAEQGLTDIFKHPLSHTVLCKVVHLPLTLSWMARYFPEIRVVQVIRHPVPMFLSWQVRDWEPEYALKLLLRQDALMDGPLKHYRAIMNEADSYWTKAAAFWSAVIKMQLLQHQRSYLMLEHEWLCYDPLPRFRGVIEALDLQWNPGIENFLTSGHAGSGPGYGNWREPASEINKWKGKVTQADMAEIWSVMQEFDLPCYRNLEITLDELKQSLVEHQGKFHVQ